MSGIGISPFAIYDPPTYAAQIAIQRRQALAQSLLEQGGANPGNAANGGLRNAGNAILGALLAKRADRQMGNLYNLQGGGDTGQVSNSPMPGSTSPSPNNQALGAALGGSAPQPGGPELDSSNVQQPVAPPNQGQAPVGQPQMQQQPQQGASQNPADYNSLPPQAQHIYDQIPHIPGMPAKQALNYFMSNPTGYQAEWAKQFEQPDTVKTANFASGGNSLAAQAYVRGGLEKAATNTLRPGNMSQNMMTGEMTGIPNAQGITPVQLPNGQIGMQTAPGALPAIQASSYASNMGAAGAKPATGYDPVTNQPIATNAAVMAGGGMAPQQAPQPAAPAPFAQNVGQSIVKALFPGAQISSGQRTPFHNAQVGGVPDSQHLDGNAVDFVLPQGRSFADVQQAFTQSGLPASELINEGSHVHWAWGAKPQQAGGGNPLLPELPPGQQNYLQTQAKDAADRHDSTVAAAQESPMRINVLDNIINLSKSGVMTGPGQEFQNSILGYAANTPLLSKVMGGAKDNIGKFQELQKFTYQNAIRSWQAAGGTGTDAQMESMAHANPNDHLFPQALQTIAQWGKAGELAVQGKANAQDQFLQQAGNNPTNQIKFESQWRNAFDPKVFQYSLMSPQEKQQFAQQTLKTPQAAKAFMAKQQQLKSMGAIQ